MSIGRPLLALLLLALAFWLLTSSGILTSKSSPASPPSAPIDRARAVAQQSEERRMQAEGVKREADSATSGTITENMTPDQIRALLGAPDDVVSETSASGSPREKWTYRGVGKTVIFENGVVVRVE